MKSKYVVISWLATMTLAHAGIVPGTLRIHAGDQADIKISSINPNYVEVSGDRITGITSSPGMLTDKRNTDAGGAFISTTQTKAFTIYLTTEGGKTFSLQAYPEKMPGRSFLLASHNPLSPEKAKAWEIAQPYESLLIELNRMLLRGQVPPGYAKIPLKDERINAPAAVRATASDAWEGSNLRVVRWQVTNAGSIPISLREQDYWQQGVRAVMFSTEGRELAGGSTMTLFVTSGHGGNDGQY